MNDLIQRNVADVARVEGREQSKLSRIDRVADLMTAFTGSVMFVVVHAIWFAVWILLNTGWIGLRSFDALPYGLLTMIVSLEAIFLSTFVLISQNREAAQADRRAKIDLQLNMMAEQEVTKLIAMVAGIQEHLGIPVTRDAAVEKMAEQTRVEDVADTVEAAEASDAKARAAVAADRRRAAR